MKRDYCVWLTAIRGQGATEYWCDRDNEGWADPECTGCKRYLSISDAMELLRNLFEFTDNIQDLL